MGGQQQTSCYLIFFVVTILAHTAAALMCFQCADTTHNTPCVQDYEGLVNTSKGLNHYYDKNCTDSNTRWDRCVIEEHKGLNGQHLFFKRGCHDGVTFSDKTEDDEFKNLSANNDTTCNYVTNRQVCFTFCTEDFCNGPQPDDDDDDEDEENCIEYDPYNNVTLKEGEAFCGGIATYAHSLTTWVVVILAWVTSWSLCV